MATDTFFITGNKHLANEMPSQDYAIHGDNWIAVADGCSSGRNTNVGAKLFLEKLYSFLNDKDLLILNNKEWLSGYLEYICNILNTHHPDDLLTTVVVASNNKYKYNVNIFGDGVVCVDYKNGNKEIISVRSPFNAPPYLLYKLQEGSLKSWEHFINYQPTLVYKNIYDTEGTLLNLSITEIDSADAMHINFNWDKKLINSVMIATDGIETFEDKKLFELCNFFTEVHNSKDMLKNKVSLTHKDFFNCDDDLAVGLMIA